MQDNFAPNFAPDDEIRVGLVNTYVRGFRAGVGGVHLDETVRGIGGAFAEGYAAGESALVLARHAAERRADMVIGSSAMAQAKRNAGVEVSP